MDIVKVTCNTPEQFSCEVKKWQSKGASPIIRGRTLIAYGEIVAELVSQRGGARQGSGRPKGNRTNTILIKISDDAHERWKKGTDRTQQIESFINSEQFIIK